MFCTKCGSNNSDDSVFCFQCGEQLKKTDSTLENNTTVIQNLSRPAGFWIRANAYILDGIFVFILEIIFNYSLFGDFSISSFSNTWSLFNFNLNMPVMILNSLLSTLYYVGLTGYYGQTFGKMIFKLKVLNNNGTEISYGTAFLRYSAYLLSLIPFCLGFIIVGFRSDKRGFHDILVGTKVIHL